MNNTEQPTGASRRTRSPFFEDTEQGAGATLRCGVTNPLQTGAGSGSEVINPRAIWSNKAESRSDLSERGEAPALEAERPGGETSSTRAQYEEMKQRAGATSRSEVRHPLWKQNDLIIAAQTEYIRPVAEAGFVPLYVELLSRGDPMGKDIVEDVFCILAVAEGNDVLIAEQLVRILRGGDSEAKFAVSDVLWDLAGYRHSGSVIMDSGAIPLLVEFVRDGSLEFREKISGAISQSSGCH
ncbi:hypothetical protein DY000_02012976 [Brassica cretica]|uniref:Uncharacterized protein n=1 Tax=Brassica cretica TaxID=69181 RepID=A0ABQ7DA15_BRACR|nr:hypothetical protein DY000_02012976 [Brassica cretica]